MCVLNIPKELQKFCMSQSVDFFKFLSYFIEKKIINCSNNLTNVDINFWKTLNKICIAKVNQDATENAAFENIII